MSSAHDHSPIWNFTYPQVATALRQAAVETGLGTVTLYQLRLRRQRGHGSPTSNVGCCSEKRSKRSRQRKIGSGSPNTMRRMRDTPSTDHVGVATSCALNTPRTDVGTRSGLRVAFRGCRQRGNLRSFWWNPPGRYFADFFSAEGGKLLVPPKREGSELKLGTPLLMQHV